MEKRIVFPTVGICKTIYSLLKEDLVSDEIDDYAPGYKFPYVLRNVANDFCSIFIDALVVNNKETNGKETFQFLDWLSAGLFYNKSDIKKIRESIVREIEKDCIDDITEKNEWLKDYFNRSLYFPEAVGIGKDLHEYAIT